MWAERHKLQGLVELKLEGRTLIWQKVERDFRALKTGLLEVRPVFVRKERGTRGHALGVSLPATEVGRQAPSRS